MKTESLENAGMLAGKTMAYGGAAGSALSGLTVSEIGVIVGIVIGVLGLVLGQFWQWRKDRREHRESEARLRHELGTNWDSPT